MKFNRILSAFAFALLLPAAAMAQDARQRTPQTIVADVLAEMPATNKAVYDEAMNDLLGTGSFGVTQLAKMLVPAESGQNNLVEYALEGLVTYTAGNATEAQRANVCEGLGTAIRACSDNPNKAFLVTLLSRISRPADAPVFVELLDDPYLGEIAQSALVLTPGTDNVVMNLITEGKLPKTTLARLAGAKHIASAEPVLLGWLKTADSETSASIYRALAECGTPASFRAMAKGAKNEGYQWVATDATASYLRLLNRLAPELAYSKAVAKEAKSLMNNKKVGSHVRASAMSALFTADNVKAAPLVVKAMSDTDREYRLAALYNSESWIDGKELGELAALAKSPKTPADVKADIIAWMGHNKCTLGVEPAIAAIGDSDTALAETAFTALSRIGGDTALATLIGCLDGDRAAMATKALLTFNGDVSSSIAAVAAGNGSAKMRGNALAIASTRRVKAAAPTVMNLLNDNALADNAYAALPGVVAPDHIAALCKLLETVPASRRATVKDAIVAALRQLPAEEQYVAIKPYFEASANKPLYYPAIAVTAAPEAVSALTAAYAEPATRSEALAALLTVDSPAMVSVLYDIAVNNKAANNEALKRYALMADRYGSATNSNYNLYRRGLEASQTAETDNMFITRLGNTGTYGALLIADARIANPETAATSAAAIRSIMSKHVGEYQGDEVRAAIVKAMDYYKAQAAQDADAGYAVDDLRGILAKHDAATVAAAAPASELTAEEKAQGFEMLFDGTSLKKWTGDTTTYIIRDGCITVDEAHWGNNIYTADEYGNFVFRFEFALDRPGVNNGVGIRTPMNLDAAFHGMEIQILDHDDPMYAGLNDYQVHGSVYGVIPAKRVKFTHGQWNTEEIRAEGDHITVTVNGKVILDGNIREACQGHAVGDPGEEGNHYMIDHRNHPGLFNKSGHIGFLGHGSGIRFRNVRILDLDK